MLDKVLTLHNPPITDKPLGGGGGDGGGALVVWQAEEVWHI